MSLIDQGFKKTHKTAVIGKRFRRGAVSPRREYCFTSAKLTVFNGIPPDVCALSLEDFYGSKNQRTIADKHPWQLSKHSWAGLSQRPHVPYPDACFEGFLIKSARNFSC
jgi:hypothetical protein